MELEIVMKPINEVIPYWRNPRRNDRLIGTLAEEIEKRGFNVPIVVDKNGVVVKGHARLRAAKKLGMEAVPCIVSNASEDVIRADRIADNKIQELSSWDYGKLDMELDKIGDGMSFKRLFRPEDSVDVDDVEMPEVDFQPAALDFSFGSDDSPVEIPNYGGDAPPQVYVQQDEGFDGAEYQAHEGGHADIPVYMPTPEAPQPKKLKTLCPYCGKLVIVSL